MKTKELIEWLNSKRIDDEYTVPDYDIKMIDEIIKKLEKLDELKEGIRHRFLDRNHIYAEGGFGSRIKNNRK